jgi:hypothetical protein
MKRYVVLHMKKDRQADLFGKLRMKKDGISD